MPRRCRSCSSRPAPPNGTIPSIFLGPSATRRATSTEGQIYAKYLLQNHRNGRVGILYQNDDYGKDYLKGLKDGLSGQMQVVAEFPYEVSDTTVDSQIF